MIILGLAVLLWKTRTFWAVLLVLGWIVRDPLSLTSLFSIAVIAFGVIIGVLQIREERLLRNYGQAGRLDAARRA